MKLTDALNFVTRDKYKLVNDDLLTSGYHISVCCEDGVFYHSDGCFYILSLFDLERTDWLVV